MILDIHYIETNKREKIRIENSRCVIGRSPKADLQIDLECFSRQHLEIFVDDKEFYVTDLNSTNGVHINNERIPTGQKILFQNFFPLEVAGKVAIYVHEDSQQAGDTVAIKYPSASLSAGDKTVQTKILRKKRAPKARQQKVPLIIGVCIILSGGWYLYSQSNQKLMLTQTTSKPEQGKQAEYKGPVVDISQAEVSSGNDECPAYEELCGSLKLNSPQEKISFSGNKLFISIDHVQGLKKLDSNFLSREPEAQQVEYLLAQVAFNPDVVNAAKMKGAQVVIVTAYDIDLARPKYSLALDVSKLKPSTKEEHANFFSAIFHGGFFRPYKKSVKPFIKFISH